MLRTVGSRVQPGHTQELSRPHEHQRRQGTTAGGWGGWGGERSGKQVQHPPYKAVWGATKCGWVPEGRLEGLSQQAVHVSQHHQGLHDNGNPTYTAELQSQRPESLCCLSPSAI